MKKIIVIDNYDSFVYNLVHYIEKLTDVKPDVYRNNEIALEEIASYDKILLSPGPGIPVEAGICLDLIKKYAPTKSILGVCLGHQAIGEAFGGNLMNLKRVYHGVAMPVNILVKDESLFNGLPNRFDVGRYHSWVVNENGLPDCFKITCKDEDGLIMGLSHTKFDVKGVQFHPESVLTGEGIQIVKNWLTL